MAVRIGHASIDENGKATGGAAGDQNSKEVLIRDWYSKPWNVLLRPVRPEVAEKSAVACEAACANPNIGYDQYGRNTLYAKAKAVGFDLAAIDTACECDCSSLIHVCAIAGGAGLTYGSNGHTTRTMVKEFVASGEYVKLTGSEYLASSKLLKRGDILVKEGSHTVMVLDDGAEVAPVAPVAPQEPIVIYYSVRMPALVKGTEGDPVKALQILLTARGFSSPLFGKFDDRTEAALIEFQQAFNIKADGRCAGDSWRALLGLTGVG